MAEDDCNPGLNVACMQILNVKRIHKVILEHIELKIVMHVLVE